VHFENLEINKWKSKNSWSKLSGWYAN